jgi:hypothetical protein
MDTLVAPPVRPQVRERVSSLLYTIRFSDGRFEHRYGAMETVGSVVVAFGREWLLTRTDGDRLCWAEPIGLS